MFNKIINNINLTRASLYLEKINTGNYNKKVKAYDKLKKLKISKEIGIRIIENATYKYDEEFKDMNINSNLLLLCFNDYQKEYGDVIVENFDEYDLDVKLDLLSYLSNTDNLDAILLWKYLVIYKFDTDDNKIPIGNLSVNKDNYDILYPDLYSVFKSDNKKYSLIILLNNFINLGIVPIDDLKKHKKDLIKHISMPIEELLKYKFKDNENYMSDKTYLGLRYVVESTLNIEYYCSNQKTKALLDKLFKHKDNQLKLFVLESYIKKKKNIKKINLNPIVKDLRSRSLLFNLLSYYKKLDAMPKKYKDNKYICESELYNRFSNDYNYEKEPVSIKFFKQIEKDDLKYNLYKFKAKKEYNEIVKDYATDYLLKNNHLDKYLDDTYETYIGISACHDFNDPFIVDDKISKYYDVYDKSKDLDNIIDSFFTKEEIKEEVIVPVEQTLEKEETKKKFSKIFNINNLFIFQLSVIVILMAILILYINGINVFNIKIAEYKGSYIKYKKSNISELTNYNEINGHDIFNIDDGIYYVLVSKKKENSEYYTYFKILLENDYKIVYVDMNNEDNAFLYNQNELNMVISGDRFIKVNNREFEYYIDKKENILTELSHETNAIIKTRIENEQSKYEEVKEENPEETESIENNENE